MGQDLANRLLGVIDKALDTLIADPTALGAR